MAVRPDEITAILKAQIEQFGAEITAVNVGTVVEAGDGIARVHGLSECMYSELVEFANGATGLALNRNHILLVGAVPVALIALAAELGLAYLRSAALKREHLSPPARS